MSRIALLALVVGMLLSQAAAAQVPVDLADFAVSPGKNLARCRPSLDLTITLNQPVPVAETFAVSLALFRIVDLTTGAVVEIDPAIARITETAGGPQAVETTFVAGQSSKVLKLELRDLAAASELLIPVAVALGGGGTEFTTIDVVEIARVSQVACP